MSRPTGAGLCPGRGFGTQGVGRADVGPTIDAGRTIGAGLTIDTGQTNNRQGW